MELDFLQKHDFDAYVAGVSRDIRGLSQARGASFEDIRSGVSQLATSKGHQVIFQ